MSLSISKLAALESAQVKISARRKTIRGAILRVCSHGPQLTSLAPREDEGSPEASGRSNLRFSLPQKFPKSSDVSSKLHEQLLDIGVAERIARGGTGGHSQVRHGGGVCLRGDAGWHTRGDGRAARGALGGA